MKNIIVFVNLCMVSLLVMSCQPKLAAEEAADAIMSGEEDRLPVLLQKMSFVDTITIDSMRICCTDEPMDGYLYTTWTYQKKEWKHWTMHQYKTTRSIIIEVDSIKRSKDHKGYIEWQSNWDDAYSIVWKDAL
ncbi:MAG: hypothetical protein MJZ75_03940 [Paludibacteraceae bacterium]|nr:hypothetical protein [Paludibacteraceae bacterium]